MQPTQTRPSQLVSRRGFLKAFLAMLAAAWAGWLVQRRVLTPAGSAAAQPVQIPLGDVPVGATRPVVYAGSPVLVMRSAEGVVALSMICTHLGCQVQWQEGNQQFYCPCHQGKFDRNGDVISGPPPVALDRIAARIAGDRIVVGEE